MKKRVLRYWWIGLILAGLLVITGLAVDKWKRFVTVKIQQPAKELTKNVFIDQTGDAEWITREEVTRYFRIYGICMGTIGKPVEVKSLDGKKILGSSQLTFRLVYVDKNKQIKSILVPLLIRLPDGRELVTDQYWDGEYEYLKANNEIQGQISDYYKDKLTVGKELDAIFYGTPENLEFGESLYTDQGGPGGNYQQLHNLYRDFLSGSKGDLFENIKNGKLKDDTVLLPIQFSSALYSGTEMLQDQLLLDNLKRLYNQQE